jgi:hypothetical protein
MNRHHRPLLRSPPRPSASHHHHQLQHQPCVATAAIAAATVAWLPSPQAFSPHYSSLSLSHVPAVSITLSLPL